MKGRHKGVITRLQRVSKPGSMQVWCGAHQLNLSIQLFYLAIPDTFYSTFASLVSYLRWQKKFISEERIQCPLIRNTRWLNMIKVTTWFDNHRINVAAYLEDKKPDCMLDSSWWLMLIVVHEIAGISAILCKYMQVHGTLMCNQNHTLKRLVFDINSKVGIIGRLSEVHCGAIDKTTRQLSDLADYAVSFVSVRGFIEDLGLFVKDSLAVMDSGNFDTLLQLYVSNILGLADGISTVVVEQNEDNEAYIDAALSVLPHQIFCILPSNFCVYLQRHRERLD